MAGLEAVWTIIQMARGIPTAASLANHGGEATQC